VHVALVYPPATDPTAPYLAVPMLTGFLRAHGVRVTPVDANVEAFDALLSPAGLAAARDRIEAHLTRLEQRPTLDHEGQLAYAALWRARGDAHAAPAGIDEAKATLRDPEAFYEPDAYAAAVATIEAALRSVSASYFPLRVDFTAYRTPFALTTPEEIARDAAPERDPFDDYVRHTLAPRLRGASVDVIGISVAFPGQLAPAYSFAHKLKELVPGAHLTVGGPAITQMLIRLKGKALARALGPFDSAVVFEGEHALLALVRAIEKKASLRELTNVVVRDPLLGARYLAAHGMEDMKALPAPDFEGLPLDRYLSPSLVLPYDPTRGCYWGKCTFCHYGLAEVGTASYREREVGQMVGHLRDMAAKHGTHRFYFSQDSVAPKTLVKLAQGLVDAGLDLRWATDLKPENYLTQERADLLRRSGAVACALGVESASPRVLSLIDKGAPVDTVRDVIVRLGAAGVAAEAMCFTDFPTETADEAVQTLRFLGDLQDDVALFIVGEFDLTHGALVAQDPARFGLSEVWQLAGDELGLGLFYEEATPSKSDRDRARVDAALGRLSSRWLLRHYPWAGAISTAHTVLYYERHGQHAFRELAGASPAPILGSRTLRAPARFDVDQARQAEVREAAIWQTLVFEERRISRAAYAKLAAATPPLPPSRTARRYRYAAGLEPAAEKIAGRRPGTSPNASKAPAARRRRPEIAARDPRT
jgi:anaerobic magnesium-protoporphyrin IX monomethyl ester cyclase